jgi:arylsulfatase
MDIQATVYGSFTAHETFDIGRDEGMPVNPEYEDQGKFIFTEGQLHKVVFDIKKMAGTGGIKASAFTDIE